MKRLVFLLFTLSALSFAQADWSTPTERSGYRTTPTYADTMAYIRRVAAADPQQVKVEQFGLTANHNPLYCVIVSKDGVTSPDAVHKANRAVVYVQNGIHSGEIEGKDASLALLRDLVITKTQAKLLDRAVLVIIPVFNVDGHERASKYNRINQNGPEVMGWRTDGRNLNLNRDYMKADTPEARAFFRLFNKWQPDFFFDNHVTDGADYQYVITYSVPHGPDQSPAIRAWLNDSLFPYVNSSVSKTHAIGPYVDPIDPNDLKKGLKISQSTPRFSDGYMVVRNRPGMLVEMHMLKDYKTRVTGNYELMRATLEVINRDADKLLAINRAADQAMLALKPGTEMVLSWVPTGETQPFNFLGYKYTVTNSDLSGDKWVQYSHEPETMTIPMQSGTKVTRTVTVPAAYIVPAAWQPVIDVLQAHGVKMRTLSAPAAYDVEIYHCPTPKWMESPFEGRHPATFSGEGIGDTQSTVPKATAQPYCVAKTEHVTYSPGSAVVPTNQVAGKVAIEWLEPEAPDSALLWNFFDTIFEQKEYGENYVMEKVARDMLAKDSQLKAEFDQKVASDPEFAKSPAARMNWFYKRSPWSQELDGRYPVGRLMQLSPATR